MALIYSISLEFLVFSFSLERGRERERCFLRVERKDFNRWTVSLSKGETERGRSGEREGIS
jgi:hypothetical protein